MDKDCQAEAFWKELANLNSQSSIKWLPLVLQLRLFLDKDGFICYGGRIHNAPLAKFPYLLAPKHPFISLTTRQYIRTLLQHCTTCKRHIGKPYPAPDPAPLPMVRTSDVAPFSVMGIDFTGALYVQQNSREQKYISVYLHVPLPRPFV